MYLREERNGTFAGAMLWRRAIDDRVPLGQMQAPCAGREAYRVLVSRSGVLVTGEGQRVDLS